MIRAIAVWLVIAAAATVWLLAMAMKAGRDAACDDFERATGDDQP